MMEFTIQIKSKPEQIMIVDDAKPSKSVEPTATRSSTNLKHSGFQGINIINLN